MARFVRRGVNSESIVFEDDDGVLFDVSGLRALGSEFYDLADRLDQQREAVSNGVLSAESFPLPWGRLVVDHPVAPMPPIKMLAIDCDGTITGSRFLPYIVGETIEDILQARGLTFDQTVFDRVFEANVGGGFDKYYYCYQEAAGLLVLGDMPSIRDFVEMAIERYVDMANDIVAGNPCEHFSIRDGWGEALESARSDGYVCWVTTNADPRILDANIRMSGLSSLINGYTTKADYPISILDRKPSAYPYLWSCQMAGVRPRQTMGFEDSANGHRALFRSGVRARVHMSDDLNPSPISFESHRLPFPDNPNSGEVIRFSPNFVVGEKSFGADALGHMIELTNSGSVMNNRIFGADRNFGLMMPRTYPRVLER